MSTPPDSPLIFGVDNARSGDDRSIVRHWIGRLPGRWCYHQYDTEGRKIAAVAGRSEAGDFRADTGELYGSLTFRSGSYFESLDEEDTLEPLPPGAQGVFCVGCNVRHPGHASRCLLASIADVTTEADIVREARELVRLKTRANKQREASQQLWRLIVTVERCDA